MTIQRLAVLAGISEPTIHAILNRQDAKLSQLQKIAETLEVSLSYFIDENSTSSSPTSQTGDFNQSGHGNSQKIRVTKAPSQELAAELAACRRELALTRALVESKDETITLLRATYKNPN